MCPLAPFATTLSVNVSILTLVIISLDRYYVILYPFKPKLRNKHCFFILTCIWAVSILLSSPNLYHYTTVLENCNGTLALKCGPFRPYEDRPSNSYRAHTIVLVLIQYVFPFFIMTVTYMGIGIHIYSDQIPNSVTKNQEKNKRKVIKMIFIVVILFMVCWFPLQLYNSLVVFTDDAINDMPYIYYIWFCANWFAMSNSSYNVFIYGICSVSSFI
jgi:hypothetical protein